MSFNRLEKINLEKRRRHQVYTTLDYLVSGITYFDFFSTDTFEIAENSRYLAQICNKKQVTSEFLLLSFFYSDIELVKFLKNFKITERRIARFITKNSKLNQIEKNNINKILSNFKADNQKFPQNVEYSYELNKLFEKAAENSLIRFKTPVITSSILFITLLEEKKCLANKMLQHILSNNIDRYLLKYKIFKTLHNHESNIRSTVKLNQQYFAYLLKTQLTDNQFTSLVDQEILSESVALFRNDLVNQSLKINLVSLLSKDIKMSMNKMNSREYTL